jgi:hypothetical protein
MQPSKRKREENVDDCMSVELNNEGGFEVKRIKSGQIAIALGFCPHYLPSSLNYLIQGKPFRMKHILSKKKAKDLFVTEKCPKNPLSYMEFKKTVVKVIRLFGNQHRKQLTEISEKFDKDSIANWPGLFRWCNSMISTISIAMIIKLREILQYAVEESMWTQSSKHFWEFEHWLSRRGRWTRSEKWNKNRDHEFSEEITQKAASEHLFIEFYY